jgi:sterol desaturase/sphingolipid hydroxylase (fatty acid hydroxylase superfamily)
LPCFVAQCNVYSIAKAAAVHRIVLTVLAGISLWTLAEYLLHRFLGHDKRTRPNAFEAEHTRHHSEGNYFAPTWKKALVGVAGVPVVTTAASMVIGRGLGLVFGVSFVGMYVTYEWVHRRAHTHRGLGAYGRFLRRHHFHHHFANPRMNHGVTTPIWDIVCGTWQTPGRIRVPEKLRMQWLVDPDTGDVYADLAPDYELIRRAA